MHFLPACNNANCIIATDRGIAIFLDTCFSTVEPLYKGHIGTNGSVLYLEVI